MRVTTVPLALLVWNLACSSPSAPATPSLVLADGPAPELRNRFPLYGIGSEDEPGCDSKGFRAFDFWLGKWNVYGPDGQLGGTNSVTREVDGCAVEEHWTDQAGGRGRSINTYDAGSGKWNQLWMDATGLA